MRALLLLAAIAACGGGTSGTSLEGSIPCGAMTCSAGQVCRDYPGSGVDASIGGGGPTYDCVSVPTSCALADCTYNNCSPCVDMLCSPTPAESLTNRQLLCLVQ